MLDNVKLKTWPWELYRRKQREQRFSRLFRVRLPSLFTLLAPVRIRPSFSSFPSVKSPLPGFCLEGDTYLPGLVWRKGGFIVARLASGGRGGTFLLVHPSHLNGGVLGDGFGGLS